MNLLKRVWISIFIVVSLAAGGIAIYGLHTVFGTQAGTSTQDRRGETAPNPLKSATYEVTGPADTVGVVSYVDEDVQPKNASFATLPWSHTITARTPGIFAYVVAQGNSDAISCRIFVNGELEDQQSSRQVNAQTSCLVKSG